MTAFNRTVQSSRLVLTRYAEEYEVIDYLRQADLSQVSEAEILRSKKWCEAMQSRLGFEEVLAAPRLRYVHQKLGAETTERLLLWALLYGWPPEMQQMEMIEKVRFARRLASHFYGESVKDVLLAGLYVRSQKTRKTRTAGYLLALFQKYLDIRAQYVERRHRRERLAQEQQATKELQSTLRSYPALLPLIVPKLFKE